MYGAECLCTRVNAAVVWWTIVIGDEETAVELPFQFQMGRFDEQTSVAVTADGASKANVFFFGFSPLSRSVCITQRVRSCLSISIR